MSAVRLWAAVILFGIIAVRIPSARAFERSVEDEDPTTALFWRFRWVIVRPAYDSSEDVPEDAVRTAITASIATWNVAAESCGSEFRLVDGGAPSGLGTNRDTSQPDLENRIRWREDAWFEEVSSDVLAITTLRYRRASGQIIDADIDVNGYDYFWTVTDVPGDANADIQNTLTHELGHLLGLAHVLDPEATMFGQSGPGDLEKRTLLQDDIDGLCFIYPGGLPTPGAPSFPSEPLRGACSAAPGGRGGFLFALVIAVAVLARRRFR